MDAKFLINLNGLDYPLFAGILNEAHERGLKSIRTELVQIPAEDNGHTAIVKAIVEIAHPSGDGEPLTFEDYGDANPKNCSARVATALIRMASTRAKGRALRDAVNIGQTMLEELPDLEGESLAPSGNGKARVAATMAANEKPMAVEVREKSETRAAGCEVCGVVLTPGQVNVSKKNFRGALLCPAHQKERLAAEKGGS